MQVCLYFIGARLLGKLTLCIDNGDPHCINGKKDVILFGFIVLDYGKCYMLLPLSKLPTVPFMYLKFLFPYLYLLLY